MPNEMEIAGVVLEVLGAIGGAAAVLAGLAKYLGERWADKYLADVRANHERQLADQKAGWDVKLSAMRSTQEQELAGLRAALEQRNHQLLEEVRMELDVAKQKRLKGFHDKLEVYRDAACLVSEVLGDMDIYYYSGLPLPEARRDEFNRKRIKAYAYIAMIAPQSVMDAFDDLADYLLLLTQGRERYVWITVRQKSLALLNEIRKDVGLDASPITYNGSL